MLENDLLQSIKEIENASSELPKLDQILDDVCKVVQDTLGFDFVAIQLKNREKQTIETIRGRGLNSEWFGLAKHTTKGDPALWDIQAHIVMNNPPRIEIIAGRDRRFDDYIFNKFGHKDQVRVFAPVILAPTELTLMSFRWDLLDQLSPNVDQPNGDRRTVLEIPIEDWSGTNGQK